MAAAESAAERSASISSLYESEEYRQSTRRHMTAVIDITNKCNLRCRMCYFSYDELFYAKTAHLAPETFLGIADAILPKACTLTLSCGSEPTCSPYFVDILKIASGYGVTALDFVTNGMLLDQRRADAVVDCGVTDVMISIDAATKEMYEHIRRGADFDRLVKNIKYLVAKREASGRTTPRLRFNATLMKSNITQAEDLVALAASLGVAYMDFRHLVVYDRLGMEDESLASHRALANHWLDRARRKAAESGVTLVACPDNFSIEGEAPPPPPASAGALLVRTLRRSLSRLKRRVWPAPPPPVTPPPPRFYCNLPFSLVIVNSSGGVLPCPYCHGEEPYGRLSERPFQEIWLGPKFSELRRRVFDRDPPDMCRRCPSAGMGKVDADEAFGTRTI
jgi:MoaA/NifB/PqqE/SkfB family radical SAM enzyme